MFEQGDRGDLVYVIEEREVEIVRVRADGAEERLASLGTGRYFGELGSCPGCDGRPPPGQSTASWSPATRFGISAA